MEQSSWERLSFVLAAVAVTAELAAVVAMAAAVVPAVVTAVVVTAVVVTAVVTMGQHPKLLSYTSSVIIALCLMSLYLTLPAALNPPQTIQVVCQVTQTGSPIIIIQNSTTITSIHTATTNTTLTEILSRSYTCP